MTTFLAILKLVPLIIQLVRAIEEAIPLPGAGKSRLELILDIMRGIYDDTAELQHAFSWDKLAGIVTKIVGTVVGALNKAGVFTTASK
jgi:hypothetical protein